MTTDHALTRICNGEEGLAVIAEYRGSIVEDRSGVTKQGRPYRIKAALHNLEVGNETYQWAEELDERLNVDKYSPPASKGQRVLVAIELRPGADRGLFRVRIRKIEALADPSPSKPSTPKA